MNYKSCIYKSFKYDFTNFPLKYSENDKNANVPFGTKEILYFFFLRE